MKKLFAANIFATRYFQFMKRRFYHAFNLLQPANLAAVYDAHTDTRIACAPGTAAPVGVYLNIVGQFKIDV